jgi:hypothetical protein
MKGINLVNSFPIFPPMQYFEFDLLTFVSKPKIDNSIWNALQKIPESQFSTLAPREVTNLIANYVQKITRHIHRWLKI